MLIIHVTGVFLIFARRRKCMCEQKEIEEKLKEKTEEYELVKKQTMVLETSIAELKANCNKKLEEKESKLQRRMEELEVKTKEADLLSAKIASLEKDKNLILESDLQKMSSESQMRVTRSKRTSRTT